MLAAANLGPKDASAFLAGQHEVDNPVPIPQGLVGAFEDRADRVGEPISVRRTFLTPLMPFASLESHSQNLQPSVPIR